MHRKEDNEKQAVTRGQERQKSGVRVALAEVPQRSRQVHTRNPRQTAVSLGQTGNQNPAK